MRNGLLIIFFLCLYFHFQSRTKTHVEEDAITLTQSAVRPSASTTKALPKLQKLEIINESTEPKLVETVSSETAAVSDEDFSEEEVYEEDVTQLRSSMRTLSARSQRTAYIEIPVRQWGCPGSPEV